jgi:hypothetical protein
MTGRSEVDMPPVPTYIGETEITAAVVVLDGPHRLLGTAAAPSEPYQFTPGDNVDPSASHSSDALNNWTQVLIR